MTEPTYGQNMTWRKEQEARIKRALLIKATPDLQCGDLNSCVQVSRCAICELANVCCPVYPLETQTCVVHRPKTEA